MSRYRDNCPLDCKVYVGELGNNGTRHELEEAFGYYGPLKNVWVARNPPGFAFVMFEDARDARDACRSLNGKLICGRRVRVELSSGKTRREMAGDMRGPGGGGGSRSPSPVGRASYRDRGPPPPRSSGGDYRSSPPLPPASMHRRGRSPRSPPPRRVRGGASPNGRSPPPRRPMSPRGRSPPDAYVRRGYDDYPARSRSPVGRRPLSRSISRSRSRSPMP